MFSGCCLQRWWVLGVLATGLSLGGCKPASRAPVAADPAAVLVSRPTEEAWMVRQVCQFLAEMGAVVQKTGSTPAAVSVRKLPTAGDDVRYEATVAGKVHVISLESGVWNPASYQPLAKEFFKQADASPVALSDQDFAEVLLSPGLTTFITQDRRLSLFLTEHPASASAQVQAALLVGTIALNDHAGSFRDLRIPINRMIAHLAAADALGAAPESMPGRRLAESLRLTLCGRQADALVSLTDLASAQNPVLVEWATVLRLRNTGDWREDRALALQGTEALKHEYFRALVRSVGAGMGLQFLRDAGVKPQAGYWRIANEVSLSVSHGHIFSKSYVAGELQEAIAAAEAYGIKVEKTNLKWLHEYAGTPEGSLVGKESGGATIQVAGRNLLAGYHVRHLMQSARKAYEFLNDDWGVKDEAKALKEFIEKRLPETRYTPFLNRMIARGDASRRAANPACETIIAEHPEWVTPTLWVALRVNEDGRDVLSCPSPHGWFRPEVPRGTAFGVEERLYEIGVGDESDNAWMKSLWSQAPFGFKLARHNAFHDNGDTYENLSPEIAGKWLGAMTGYHLPSIRFMANTYKAQPAQYQELMNQAAMLDPDLYLDLGEYLNDRGLRDEAARAYLQAFEKAEDRVYMANESGWLVTYLYEKGDLALATKVAEAAAEVYSYGGLEAHLWLLEKQRNWKAALDTARKLDQRYNGLTPVEELACLLRLAQADLPAARALGYEARMAKVFPGGMTKVTLADFKTAAPRRGVLIDGTSPKMTPFGLREGMVIVAMNGIRTDTFTQYQLVRALTSEPLIRLIVWDGAAYRVSEGSLPGRRFGVDMKDYTK